MRKHKNIKFLRFSILLLMLLLIALLLWLLWKFVPRASVRFCLLAVCAGILAAAGLLNWYQRLQISSFAGEICETLDALMSGRQPEDYHPYEDSLTSRVQGKLLQYYDIMNEGKLQSQKDKETIQGLVSDISHQVKTPVANLRLYAGILKNPALPAEKRNEFLGTMSGQIDKLDFLLQSLIKMSRLETGTFALHITEAPLKDTIAAAMSTVWARAEEKGIALLADCDSGITVQHDPKWTAEALGNILDNAVKYTPGGGSVAITVRPWQFYTRIDITDTGTGIPEEHYNDIFQRFYRGQEAAAQDGIDLAIEKGKFTAIIGASGSGKTTLLNMLGGLDTPDEGEVIVDGVSLAGLKEKELAVFRRGKVGFVYQNFNLIPTLTVKENMLFPLSLAGSTPDPVFFQEILTLLHLEDRQNAYPNQLSGGGQQRVAIARALIAKPSVILADEPTGNLDSKSSQNVLGLLKLSVETWKQTLVMITHNLEIAQMADRVIRIEDGRIRA